MSKKSKVIRATVSGIFLLVLAIVIIVLTKDSYMNPSSIKIELKIYYAVALVISILGYGLLKNRLVKMNIKKGIEYIYTFF